MTPVEALVKSLLRHAERLGRSEFLRRLRPGLSVPDCAEALSHAGLGQPRPVLDWFHCADGVETEGAVLGEVYLLPGYYPLSLSDALRHRAESTWPREWLPLLANGGGDYFLVDASSDSASVIEFIVYDLPAGQVATRLEDFLRVAVAAFERGVVFVDDEGHLEQDDVRWRQMMESTG